MNFFPWKRLVNQATHRRTVARNSNETNRIDSPNLHLQELKAHRPAEQQHSLDIRFFIRRFEKNEKRALRNVETMKGQISRRFERVISSVQSQTFCLVC